ncbi:MAG: signal peptidase I [Candidatus Zambryskibacteria bacterium RIFCSPHIGHO2_02_FULL_43_14]|uniref:Signal peptidase I n=1 Tax=Candidatus Zambryskibacteria bacterium RIFCSPHIGHO2_02_FULL_43_14 TaxID=1802748 RepID=A0A1G2TH88_9BACT|nr:MAG: signal peptidase I [Candidatus Zambryskibacteria bacterium RIFCSPHIGHO2_01_FULL_43_60]OHA96665.1 MAG: signal peptidase I [Candidatus Zambryskibacteria bacterium RIFCSPHIGHO2_02_FULL_43_14]OHB03992.1 MAG: signal peptidase I [Candidatus Zambryskibacteria bacterium RIFCSPLOWO2_01_FULL_42_41]
MKRFIAKATYGIFMFLLVGVASLFFAPLLPIKGNIEIKIVKSGSMEPFIKTGSIVVIKPASVYNVGDIITFGEDSSISYPTTHRIISISEIQDKILYQAKGDANEEPDPTSVKKNDVIGKVIFTAPNVGYLLDFARQPVGFILLIAFPAALVILNEIIDIGKEIRKVIRRKKGDSTKVPTNKVLKRIHQMDDVLRPVYFVYSDNTKRKTKAPFTISVFIFFGIGLIFTGFSGTTSYFSDAESSSGSVFDAGILDIILSNTGFEGVISNSTSDESQFQTNVSLVVGSLPTQYTVEYEKTGGDDSLCDALALSATSDVLSYSGALSAFSVGTTVDFGLWDFAISVLSGQSITGGETCEFDLIYKAWMDGVPSFETSGFRDEERFHISITAETIAASVVINEFLPRPDGPLCSDQNNASCDASDPDFIFDFGTDSSDKPQGEWVELYNLTGAPVNLSGWYTQDASGGMGNTDITNLNTLPATTTIPASGYLVVYMNKSVWNNTGDTVKLFNASNILQDSYAYTSDYDYCDLIPTSGEINDEIPSDPDGDCVNGSNIPSNKSYARIPNGTGSFVDPIPTPGKSNNVLEKNTEIIPVELVNIFSPIFDLSTPTATNGPSPTSIEEIEVVEPEIKISTSTQSLLDISSSVEVVEDTSAGQVEMILEETIIPETVVPEESTEIPTEPVAVEVIDIKSC